MRFTYNQCVSKHFKYYYISFYLCSNFLRAKRNSSGIGLHRSLQWNQLDALISQIYFWSETLHVADSSSVHHQEFFTVHTAIVYPIPVCGRLASRPQTGITYTIAMCTVKNSWWWTEELSETCRVSYQELIWEISAFHPDPALKLSADLYDIYHCCVYSENSWWWTEELSETCRVSLQK